MIQVSLDAVRRRVEGREFRMALQVLHCEFCVLRNDRASGVMEAQSVVVYGKRDDIEVAVA